MWFLQHCSVAVPPLLHNFCSNYQQSTVYVCSPTLALLSHDA